MTGFRMRMKEGYSIKPIRKKEQMGMAETVGWQSVVGPDVHREQSTVGSRLSVPNVHQEQLSFGNLNERAG